MFTLLNSGLNKKGGCFISTDFSTILSRRGLNEYEFLLECDLNAPLPSVQHAAVQGKAAFTWQMNSKKRKLRQI